MMEYDFQLPLKLENPSTHGSLHEKLFSRGERLLKPVNAIVPM